jgi:hypothetical protein
MFCLFSVLVLLTGVARAAANFQGNLPYELYSDGDGCTESNFVGTGSIISLTVMDEAGTFCETDVLDPSPPEFPDSQTVYTKILLGGCDGETGDVDVTFWQCTTGDCSRCIPSLKGTTTVGNFTATRDNLSECFYGWPSFPSDGGMAPVIGYQTFDESMGATDAQDEEFFDLLIANSCMAGMVNTDETPTSGLMRNMQVTAAGYFRAGISIVVALSLFVGSTN